MEEIREEKVSQILSWLQAAARGKMSRKTYKKLQQQKVKTHAWNSNSYLLTKTFIFFVTVGTILHPTNHQEFYDWQELELVDTMVENQTEFAKCKVC